MKFKLSIDMENDAMLDARAVASALAHVSLSLPTMYEAGVRARRILDANGNTVGFWSFEGVRSAEGEER